MEPHELALTPVEIERFWDKVIPEPMSGCWLWTAALAYKGYGHITSRRLKRTLMAHRVSWQLTHGTIPDGLLVLHKCDTPLCVNPSHLFVGTYADNTRDMYKKGRHPGPSLAFRMCPRLRKLTEGKAAEMVTLYKSGAGYRTVARKYGVAPGTFGQYLRRAGVSSNSSRSGPFANGAKHPNAVLTDEQVLSIRAALADGRRSCDVARAHGVSQGLVHLIRHRKIWAHL